MIRFCVVLEADRHLLDRPVVGEGDLVVFCQGRAVVAANVGGLIERERASLGLIDAPLGDFLAIDEDGAEAPFSRAAAVIRKFEADCRFAWGELRF